MKYFIFIFSFFIVCQATAQTKASNDSVHAKQLIDSVNRFIDRAVVAKQAWVLEKHFADDFIFTHSTGHVDSKQSWIKYVLDSGTHYLSRLHDSTFVELHKNIAIVSGSLIVHAQSKGSENGYALHYIRVFVYRNKVWQLLSHRSTAEWRL